VQQRKLTRPQSILAHTESRYEEEHARSIRFETSWRDAEDRAANQQFELERVKAELDDVKKQLAAVKTDKS
jgi:bHLH factor